MKHLEIFLIRHAHVAYYTPEGEKYKVPIYKNHLSPLGWLQSLELDYNLHQSGLKFEAIFSSSYSRTIETIFPYSIRSGLEIQKFWNLREIRCEGNYDLWKKLSKTDKFFKHKGGESFTESVGRFEAQVSDILKLCEHNSFKQVLLVSHGAILSAWLSKLFPNQDIDMGWPDVYQLTFKNNRFIEVKQRLDLVPYNQSFKKDLEIFPKLILD